MRVISDTDKRLQVLYNLERFVIVARAIVRSSRLGHFGAVRDLVAWLDWVPELTLSRIDPSFNQAELAYFVAALLCREEHRAGCKCVSPIDTTQLRAA